MHLRCPSLLVFCAVDAVTRRPVRSMVIDGKDVLYTINPSRYINEDPGHRSHHLTSCLRIGSFRPSPLGCVVNNDIIAFFRDHFTNGWTFLSSLIGSSVISILTWAWNEENSDKDVKCTHFGRMCVAQIFHQNSSITVRSAHK